MGYIGSSVVKLRFDSFKELNTNFTRLIAEKEISLLCLIPKSTKKHLLLGYDFKISQILSTLNFINKITTVSINNLKGFNLQMSVALPKIFVNSVHFMSFVDSNFDFYLNESTPISKELCAIQHFEMTSIF